MSYNPFSFDAFNPLKKENFFNPISPHFGNSFTLLFGELDDDDDDDDDDNDEELNENE